MFITSRLTPQNILHPARQTPTEASAILCLKHVVKPIITQGQVSMMQQGIRIIFKEIRKRNKLFLTYALNNSEFNPKHST